jgi:hypothetical protein
MNDGLDFSLGHHSSHQFPIVQIAFDKNGSRRDHLAVSFDQIVDHCRFMTGIQALLYNHTSDIPGPAGNQYIHN